MILVYKVPRDLMVNLDQPDLLDSQDHLVKEVILDLLAQQETLDLRVPADQKEM